VRACAVGHAFWKQLCLEHGIRPGTPLAPPPRALSLSPSLSLSLSISLHIGSDSASAFHAVMGCRAVERCRVYALL
jgi:hypothetical protein